MAGSAFGSILKVTTFGESHGAATGAVLDGCPAGVPLCAGDIQQYLDRRRPGASPVATARKEPDTVEILSGVFEGRTSGTPIALLIRNSDQHSSDYDSLKDVYRPGHADYTFDRKYGIRDHRGGGRSSGRETAARVAAGAVAAKVLSELGITVTAYTKSIGPVEADTSCIDPDVIRSLPTAMPDKAADEKALLYLQGLREKGDSAGGVIEVIISGLPAGIGEPVFDKLDARLSAAFMSIGAVKAVEIGDGFSVSGALGSENNDSFYEDNDGNIKKRSNHAGGILGGISDGADIRARLYVKPTPSISAKQHTVRTDGTETSLSISGRHDPVIVPRAVVVAEMMAALAILDLMLVNMSSRLEYLKDIYGTDRT
ncbi:MAG: chorismate synthase [Lachnospiraceae bacterium]|nr:chorismate synthase [Lachnospiraceae bacterium]